MLNTYPANTLNQKRNKRFFSKPLLLALATSFVLASCTKDVDVVAPAASAEYHWDYENTGDWASHYPECAGAQQSPINIIPALTAKTKLSPIDFDYKSFPMSIVDNGHTVQVNVPKGQSFITYNGEEYELKQFHFHRHSEHKIDGAGAAMEVHFVHQHPKTGVLTVLGVMLKEGKKNKFIEDVWNHFPTGKNTVLNTSVTINPMDLLPEEKSFYSYAGSLTTPPCYQGVNWVVFKSMKELSHEQAEKFPHHENARPVQPLNGRIVTESSF